MSAIFNLEAMRASCNIQISESCRRNTFQQDMTVMEQESAQINYADSYALARFPGNTNSVDNQVEFSDQLSVDCSMQISKESQAEANMSSK